MDVVDVLLIILLVGSLVLGIQRGLVASIGVLIGLVAGAFAAFWLMPVVNGAWPWPSSRIAAVIAVGVVLVVVGAAIGGAIGAFLRRGVDRIKLRGIDRGGAVVVVRPDMYVANVLPLTATAELAAFFRQMLLVR